MVVFRGFPEDHESKSMDIDDNPPQQTEKLDIKYEMDHQATTKRVELNDW